MQNLVIQIPTMKTKNKYNNKECHDLVSKTDFSYNFTIVESFIVAMLQESLTVEAESLIEKTRWDYKSWIVALKGRNMCFVAYWCALILAFHPLKCRRWLMNWASHLKESKSYEQIIKIDGIKAYTQHSLTCSQQRGERLLDQKTCVTS